MFGLILSVLALLPSVKGLCYSPMLHGFAPDVILPSMLSSEIYCPPPHVFDPFVCMCVDASVVKLRVPTESRTSLELSLLNTQHVTSNPAFRLPPALVGLPDMHVPGQSHRWPAVRPFKMARSPSAASLPGRVVPVLNPYGSFNLPAKPKLVKEVGKVPVVEASLPSKQQEILEKVRWQKQLQREVAVVAAAELAAGAAAASAVPVSPTGSGGESTLDLFMRDTLRRILYGY